MDTILVTGATGNVGSGVVRELQGRGVAVRALVRDASKAAALLGSVVEIAVGDFGDAGSIRRAMEGVTSVFIACANDPRQVDYETGVIDAAKAAGVKRIVKLSALGAEIGSPVAFWDWHGKIEAHLRASGVPAVVLRPTFNMTNLLASVEAVRHTGNLFAPAAGARVAMIDPRDIAVVAAVALTDGTHEGRTYTLTGPEAISFERVAGELSGAAGRPVQFVPVPDEAALQAMTGVGMPEFVAAQIVSIFGFLRRGDQEQTTGVVHALTGREPRDIARFAQDFAGLFRANAA